MLVGTVGNLFGNINHYFCYFIWCSYSGVKMTRYFALQYSFHEDIMNYFTYSKGHMTAFSVQSSPDLPREGMWCQLFVLPIGVEKQISFFPKEDNQRGSFRKHLIYFPIFVWWGVTHLGCFSQTSKQVERLRLTPFLLSPQTGEWN